MAFDPITAALNLGTTIIDRVIPDRAAAQKAKDDLMALKQNGELAAMASQSQYDLAAMQGQLAINTTEASAASRASNLFVQFWVAGWRPAVGWAGALGFAYVTLGQPLLTYMGALFGHPIVAPKIDSDVLMQVLFGLLGLGTMRSIEKIKGASSGQ